MEHAVLTYGLYGLTRLHVWLGRRQLFTVTQNPGDLHLPIQRLGISLASFPNTQNKPILTFGSISPRTSFNNCKSCIDSNESNVIKLKFFLKGSLLSFSTMNFSWSLMMVLGKTTWKKEKKDKKQLQSRSTTQSVHLYQGNRSSLHNTHDRQGGIVQPKVQLKPQMEYSGFICRSDVNVCIYVKKALLLSPAAKIPRCQKLQQECTTCSPEAVAHQHLWCSM